MRIPFIIVTGLLGILIAWGYPFVAVLRGRKFSGTIYKTWGLLFLYTIVLCIGVPSFVSGFDERLAKEMWVTWVPEGPGVVAMAFMGWLPPLMAAMIALVVKEVMNVFWPKTLARIQKTKATDAPSKCP